MSDRVQVDTSELTGNAGTMAELAERVKRITPEFEDVCGAMPGSVSAGLVELMAEGLGAAFDSWGERGNTHAVNLSTAADAYDSTDRCAAADHRGPLLRRSTILDR